jgi:hypothetical protein
LGAVLAQCSDTPPLSAGHANIELGGKKEMEADC